MNTCFAFLQRESHQGAVFNWSKEGSDNFYRDLDGYIDIKSFSHGSFPLPEEVTTSSLECIPDICDHVLVVNPNDETIYLIERSIAQSRDVSYLYYRDKSLYKVYTSEELFEELINDRPILITNEDK